MAKQQTKRRSPSRSERDSGNGGDRDVASDVEELTDYLQERIKPGLNRGAIPLLARSIARELADRERAGDAEAEDEYDDEVLDEADAEVSDESDDEYAEEADEDEVTEEADEDEADAEGPFVPPDFEAEMHDFQSELGEEWILRFSVQGGDAWLTAETDDGSQRVEAQAPSVLAEAVALLKEGAE